ncbi:DNA cytosine methyltransferase [Longispora albida]|uniref:DNA cytosine methyltransferase n=1 Tax=Longispora albida TaxID=203523 RepID=UPI0003734058|nr:DNA cytosine methyltransferase [Longispora albida]
MLTIGSLCSGYGGLDAGLVDALGGGTIAWHAETDPHASAVLAARYPGVPNLGDLTLADWTATPPVDWIVGGYPCQPFSLAGPRRGEDDPRNIWPSIAAAIRQLRPRFVLLENVSGHLSKGFGRVLGDLSTLGYLGAWRSVRASDVGAPHRRQRVFILAVDASRLDGLPVTEPAAPPANRDLALMATPAARDGRGISPLPNISSLPNTVSLLPTLRSSPFGLNDNPESWLARNKLLAARRSKGASGMPLGVAVQLAAEEGSRWGQYATAIARWEQVTGRPAPDPIEQGRTAPRLNARFAEWMMGLSGGYVTDVVTTYSRALRVIGNGVVNLQASHAVKLLLADLAELARA